MLSLTDRSGSPHMPLEVHYSACPHDCPSVCALDVEVEDGVRIGRVRGGKRNPYTAGVVCAKVARYAERQHHPDRLKTPLRKTASGFVPCSWDDALDEIAENFTAAVQRYGAETVWPYFYAGNMGLVSRDGINRLRHAGGYSQQDGTFCVTLGNGGWKAGVGGRQGVNGLEMAKADTVIAWGANLVHTQVNAMTHIARGRKERGTKLVVVDVYENATAKQADLFVPVRPSTDGALAAALAHCLLRDGAVDREYLARLSDFDAATEAHYAACTPGWASAICGTPVETIEAFAALLKGSAKAFFKIGYGFTRTRVGAVSMHAVTCLPTLMGAWQYEGGGALYSQSGRYGIDNELIEGGSLSDPSVRMLDMSRIGPALTNDPEDLAGGPPVTAMLIQCTNPASVAPELRKVHAGFARDDLFVAVHEQFMTETAELADIVLPATTFLENDDLYTASGHNELQVVRPLVPACAQARSNHDVICALAERLGLADCHPAFRMSARELVDQTLARSGYPSGDEIYAAGGHSTDGNFEEDHFINSFPNETGRFRFRADWASVGAAHHDLPQMPGYCDLYEQPTVQHPFRLATSPARNFLNSSFTETPTSLKNEARPTVKIARETAAELGIAEGDLVRLFNDRGSLRIHAEIADGQLPQTLIVESIWPNKYFVDGLGINQLVRATRGLPNGGGVFHDNAVGLEKA